VRDKRRRRARASLCWAGTPEEGEAILAHPTPPPYNYWRRALLSFGVHLICMYWNAMRMATWPQSAHPAAGAMTVQVLYVPTVCLPKVALCS